MTIGTKDSRLASRSTTTNLPASQPAAQRSSGESGRSAANSVAEILAQAALSDNTLGSFAAGQQLINRFGIDTLADEYRVTADRLIDSALADTEGYNRLAHLGYRIGNRLSGSPPLDEAIAWSTDQMKSAGLSNVRILPVRRAYAHAQAQHVKLPFYRRDDARELLAAHPVRNLPQSVATLKEIGKLLDRVGAGAILPGGEDTDPDHFDPANMIACLRSNPKARLVAHSQAVDLLNSAEVCRHLL